MIFFLGGLVYLIAGAIMLSLQVAFLLIAAFLHFVAWLWDGLRRDAGLTWWGPHDLEDANREGTLRRPRSVP